MDSTSNNVDLEFAGLYMVPGEGVVAALRDAAGTQLYDKKGLQHRILEKQKIGKDAAVEEQALARINQITSPNSDIEQF